jgi:ribosomal protein S14
MAIRPKFPLPKGYFGPLPLSKEQEERYREIVRKRLQIALADEHEFAITRRRQVDAAKWKLVKSKNQLHIYRRRQATVVLGDNKQPSMLCIGRMEGTLEDVVYGTYDKSHEEMKISMKYIDTTCKDCTVLQNIDLATPTDPFHYLGFKYLVSKFPGGFVIKDRDWPYMEAAGIEKDSTGRRYAYLIMHSVNLPNVAPWDRSDVVRGQLFFTFLFRELEGGFVEIFSMGLFDPAGEMIQKFSSIMTQETLMAVSKSVKCAEAKKLTILALAYYTEKTHFNKHRCSVCTSTGGVFSSLKTCRVCGAPVCSKCRVKKFIFAGPNRDIVNISCCPPCVLKSKTMDVRPAEEAFSILAEKHLPEELFRADSSAFSDAPEVPTPRDHNFLADEDKSTICESEDEGYSLSVSSGMSEDDVEGMIEAMMKKKLTNSRRGENNSVGSDPRSVLLEEHVEYMNSVPLYGGSGNPSSVRLTGNSRGSHVPQYDHGGYYQQPPSQPSSTRSNSGYQVEFEFRNLNQHQNHHQPQYQQQPQYRSEFQSNAPQQHSEFRNQHPPRGSAPMDYRSASPHHRQQQQQQQQQQQVDYRSPGLSSDYRGASPMHQNPNNHSNGNGYDYRGGGVLPSTPSNLPVDYRSLATSTSQVGGVHQINPHQAAMGPQPGMAPHQAELFHKMIALQNSAQQVYAMTKANEEYMRNLHN